MGSIFFSQPLPQSHRPVNNGIMYKSIFRVRLGSRWLFAGVRLSGSPFHFSVQRYSITDYTLRLLWFEFCLSELPF